MLCRHACLVLLVCWNSVARVQGARSLVAENAAAAGQQWGRERDRNPGGPAGWGGLGGRSSANQPAPQQQPWLQQPTQQPSSDGSGGSPPTSTTSGLGGLGGLGSSSSSSNTNNNDQDNNNQGGGWGGLGGRGNNNNGGNRGNGGMGSWLGGRPQQFTMQPAPTPAPVAMPEPSVAPPPALAPAPAPQEQGGSSGGRWGGLGGWGSNNRNNGWNGGQSGWGGRGNNNNGNNNGQANSGGGNNGVGDSANGGIGGSEQQQQPAKPAGNSGSNSGQSSPGWGGWTNRWGQNNNNNNNNNNGQGNGVNTGPSSPGQGGLGGSAIGRQGDRAALAPVIGDVAQYSRINRRNIPLTGTASTLAEGIRRRGNTAAAVQGLTQAFDRGQGDAAAQAVAGAVASGGDSAAIGETLAEATQRQPKAGSFLLRKSAELAVNNGQVQGFSRTMSNAFAYARRSRYMPQFTNAVADAISTGGAPARYAYGSAIATAIAEGGDSQAAIAEATAEAFCTGGSVAQSWASAYAVALSQDSRGCLVLNEARALAVAKCGNGVSESFTRAQATSTVLGFCGLFSWLPAAGWSGSNTGSNTAGNGWATSSGQGTTGYNNGYWGK